VRSHRSLQQQQKGAIMKRFMLWVVLLFCACTASVQNDTEILEDARETTARRTTDTQSIWVDSFIVVLDSFPIYLNPRAYMHIIYGDWVDVSQVDGEIYHAYFTWPDTTFGTDCDSMYYEPFGFGCLMRQVVRRYLTDQDTIPKIEWSGGILSIYLMNGATFPSVILPGVNPGVHIRKTGGMNVTR
jgi:hypothetical protein